MRSSSTTPAETRRKEAPREPARRPDASGLRTTIAWVLLVVWAVLIGLGISSLFSPDWLEKMQRKGRAAEGSAAKSLGDLAYRRGEYARAAALYLDAAKIDPLAADIQHNLGTSYLEIGQVALAREALLRAQSLNPTSRVRLRIELHLGDVARKEGRFEEALRYYGQALGPDLRNDLVYRKIGTLQTELGNFELARDAFERALASQLDPALPLQEMLNRARDGADVDADAKAWLDAWGSRDISDIDWSKFDRELLEQMHASDPEVAKIHNYLGLIYDRLNQPEKAIEHFEASLRIWPNNMDAVQNLRILRSRQ